MADFQGERTDVKAIVTPVKRSMISRTDRTKERYDETGARLVAGIVPLSSAKTHPGYPERKYILCISSTNNKQLWVLPKGGWEIDELIEEAALREAWEEAGIVGKITCSLGMMHDPRPAKTFQRAVKYVMQESHPYVFHDSCIPPRAVFQYFELDVERLEDEYPEMNKRVRKWMTYSEAKEALAWRLEMVEALERSSILKI
ncbi:hypothetical protein T552_00317 [Pneumocystis carinii B80]|uniref:Nudix hydrolase domain-containing protein n=1 Tax=Pneumocystis carinii (strain B80) TaxID=1408658 RepID=A0A0W4ZQG3_PNEC8|nr:hypothetical protein T552_00317 [Pneumocystis carinii B80]KTW30600.1 hypothetical protein T552_00317 [Pneumocystis carinii B80]